MSPIELLFVLIIAYSPIYLFLWFIYQKILIYEIAANAAQIGWFSLKRGIEISQFVNNNLGSTNNQLVGGLTNNQSSNRSREDAESANDRREDYPALNSSENISKILQSTVGRLHSMYDTESTVNLTELPHYDDLVFEISSSIAERRSPNAMMVAAIVIQWL